MTTSLSIGPNAQSGMLVPSASDLSLVVTGAEFLVAMAEQRWVARPGEPIAKNWGAKGQQELEKIERQIGKLATMAGQDEPTHAHLQQLQERIQNVRENASLNRTGWIKTELARHPQRPHTLDYIDKIFTDWSEIHGDRSFGDDPAIVCGMARFHGREVVVVGTQKGRDMKQKVRRNFGLPNPEGYRKALRVMKIAEKFSRPIFTLVDVTGANPGLGAEERGQAEAIARNLREMSRLRVPIITVLTGEGGSGGALAIAVADRVLMMENAIYSVISPEGCAAIMWRDVSKKEAAAQALKITAADLEELGCIDDTVAEPEGGAHNDHDAAAKLLDQALERHLADLVKMPIEQLLAARYEKFRKMAQFFVVV